MIENIFKEPEAHADTASSGKDQLNQNLYPHAHKQSNKMIS